MWDCTIFEKIQAYILQFQKSKPLCRSFPENLLKNFVVAFSWNNCKKVVLQNFSLFHSGIFCPICATSFAENRSDKSQIEIRDKSWKYFHLMPYTQWNFFRWILISFCERELISTIYWLDRRIVRKQLDINLQIKDFFQKSGSVTFLSL